MCGKKRNHCKSPTIEARYDLILDDGNKLSRVQVKYGGAAKANASGSILVDFRIRNGTRTSTYNNYSKSETDAILVYIPDIDEVLWFGPEMFDGRSTLTIRLEKAKNNQTKKILFASDYIW